MMKIKGYVLFLLIGLISSCVQKDHYDRFKITFHSNGNRMEFIPLNKDSLIHGMYKSYFENGNMRSEVLFEKGEPTGVERLYSVDGYLETEITWKNGTRNGPGVSYDSKGNPILKFYFTNDSRMGIEEAYRSDGTLQFFSLINHKEQVVFEREFDRLGQVIKEFGQPYYYVYNKNELKLMDSFDVLIYSAFPKAVRGNFYFELLQNGQLIDTLDLDFENKQYAYVAFVSHQFDKAGSYAIRLVIETPGKETIVGDTLAVNVVP